MLCVARVIFKQCARISRAFSGGAVLKRTRSAKCAQCAALCALHHTLRYRKQVYWCAMPGTMSSKQPEHSGCLQASINSSKITVVVRPCMPGEVPGSNNSTCNKCPSGQYSFNPANATCDVCPGDSDTAKCTATSQVLSLEGHWHSGPQSTLIHPCPNPQACQ